MTRCILLGATLLLAGAAPAAAAADWNHIGAVTFGEQFDRQNQYTRFYGPVESLRFSADGVVRCRSINITTADGRSRNIFSGTLDDGQRRIVDLAGDRREIRNITFDCRSFDSPNGSIDIAADVAPLPAETGDEFPGATNRDRWIAFGHEIFGTRPRLGRHTAGFAGNNVQAVGFEPIGADAQCVRATAHYDDGDIRELNLGRNVMREGLLYRVELPGDRNVRELDLECHAVGDRSVTINLFGSKDIAASAG